LQVLVDSSRERIDRVLKQNSDIRSLVLNGWIQLLAMEGTATFICNGSSGWQLYADGPHVPRADK
jgi:uncharacterized protein YbcC (UPF0753/DUF2309 family)